MKIRKQDTVLIAGGKYRGKTGKVTKVFTKENRLVIEGVNLVKKHVRAKKSGEKGKVVEMAAPISLANVRLICKKCKKPTRVGYQFIEQKGKRVKIRICKKCLKEI